MAMRQAPLGIAFVALLAALLGLPPSAQACGPDSDCVLESGTYRIRMPKGWDGQAKVGAVVFFHGYRGKSAVEMRDPKLGGTVSDLGLALIVPQGKDGRWGFPGSPRAERDDAAFIGAVLDDAVANHSIDPARVMASGFSLGASMVWYLACNLSGRFAGFAPVSGAFWEPVPTTCPGPSPNLIHVHGLNDETVPMRGRAIGRDWHQGDVRQGLAVWLDKGACGAEVPVTRRDGRLKCERRSGCGGAVVELCLHEGGHTFRPEWLAMAWREIEAATARTPKSDAPAADLRLEEEQ